MEDLPRRPDFNKSKYGLRDQRIREKFRVTVIAMLAGVAILALAGYKVFTLLLHVPN